MAQSRVRTGRVSMVLAVLFSAAVAVVGVHPVFSDVSAVKGSAFGFQSSVGLFGGAAQARGPAPTVSLPATGSATPITSTAPSSSAQYGPAIIFTSDQVEVSTRGTTGAGGSVTTATKIANVNKSGQEVFTSSEVTSSCTASESGVSGTTTIANGKLVTSEGNPNVDGDETTVALPANPAPNTTINGAIETVGDTFRYVFNEQTVNADGSITVNAAHQYLLGPTAVGDLIIGQAVCGVTATAATTTTTTPSGSTTTTAPGATTTTTLATTTTTTSATTTTTASTTTTTAATTTTTAASTTTTAGGGTTTGVSGGAYGFYTTVALFGGPPGTRGPTPAVTLPAGGSATPITDSAATGNAQFGPAILFSSDQLDVSTQGTAGGTVTSSAKIANVNRSGQEQFTASSVSSTCTASATGETGSASIAGGKLVVSSGTDLDSEADDTVVQIPADPSPNTSYEGKIEEVGDSFRVVVNEQQRSSRSITVNAVHLYLLGPTAVGELIVGQSRCGTSGEAPSGGGGSTGGGQGGSASAAGGRVATTGTEAAALVAFALVLATGGGTTTLWAQRLRVRRRIARAMPWARRGILR